MSDSNYQTKVYRKQGGDELVIASSGQQTVEDGGEIGVESGGKLDIDTGAEMYIGERSSAFYAEHLGGLLDALFTHSIITNSAGVLQSLVAMGGSNPPIMYSAPGTYHLSLATAASNASLRLPSATRVGQVLIFDGTTMAISASVLITASNSGLTGVKLSNWAGVECSCFRMFVSQLSDAKPKVTLICDAVGHWAVADYSEDASVTFQPAA
jgi:hypothetical protein